MHKKQDFLLSLIVATAAMTPALRQDVAAEAGTASSSAPSIASIPDFSGTWAHPFLNGLEPPLSGAGPVTNKLGHSISAASPPHFSPACSAFVRWSASQRGADWVAPADCDALHWPRELQAAMDP
jgi:hypothetical protein